MLDFSIINNQRWGELRDSIVNFIKEEVTNQRKDGILIGISGGIDSAVVCALAAEALPKEKIFGFILPDKDSSPETVKEARMVADRFYITNLIVEDISEKLEVFGTYKLFGDLYQVSSEEREKLITKKRKELFGEKSDNDSGFIYQYRKDKTSTRNRIRAFWNSKIRMRMMTFYFHAELNNLLVAGTTNKSEHRIGWFTKYGDGAVDIEPLLSLYKTRVYEFASFLGVPDKIINKKPTGDILPGIEDEISLGIPYNVLDKILIGLEKKLNYEQISNELDLKIEIVESINDLIKSSYYSRVLPTECELKID